MSLVIFFPHEPFVLKNRNKITLVLMTENPKKASFLRFINFKVVCLGCFHMQVPCLIFSDPAHDVF